MTELPIRKGLQKPNVAGQMVRWAVELFEFNVQYEPRWPIKGQVYAEFVVKLSSIATHQDSGGFQWVLSVDRSSNQQDSGVGIILEASNTQAEYEVLVAGMLLAKEMGARSLLVKSDSLLVTGKVIGEYQAKDP